jgi:hypothetical protein
MPQPFWDTGATVNGGSGTIATGNDGKTSALFVVAGGNTDCLLPDVSSGGSRLPDRWAFDVIYMAGLRVPGLCDVKVKRAHRLDRRCANGVDGGAMTSLGYNPAEVTIKLRMWTPQQLLDFQAITIDSIQPRPGKAMARPVAVQVEYPSLGMWGIKSLFVVSIAGPERTSIPQLWETTLTCDELSPLTAVAVATQRGGGVATNANAITGSKGTPVPKSAPSASINSPTTGQ